jgi:3-dehydroquinate synthetase
MCSDEVKARLIPVLKRLDLPTEAEFDREAVLVAVSHDKKSVGDGVSAVTVNKIGTFEIKKYTMNELRAIVTGK